MTDKNLNVPGAKDDSGKVLAGLLLDFSRALNEVAAVGTFGAQKYTRGGWQEVEDAEQRYTDALMRHLLKTPTEGIDPESGFSHWACVAWNALAVLELKLRKQVTEPRKWYGDREERADMCSWANWEAVNSNGGIYWFEYEPTFQGEHWETLGGRSAPVGEIDNYSPAEAPHTLTALRAWSHQRGG